MAIFTCALKVRHGSEESWCPFLFIVFQYLSVAPRGQANSMVESCTPRKPPQSIPVVCMLLHSYIVITIVLKAVCYKRNEVWTFSVTLRNFNRVCFSNLRRWCASWRVEWISRLIPNHSVVTCGTSRILELHRTKRECYSKNVRRNYRVRILACAQVSKLREYTMRWETFGGPFRNGSVITISTDESLVYQ